jgi:S-adenosylmethionine:tRNA ribosyltransferase-isomerase
MDEERYEISEETARAINAARRSGRPVVAVGTTVVRALEGAARASDDGDVKSGAGGTALFLMPGAEFRVVTDLITNFHLPRSTLLMLVAAFAGRQRVLDAYRAAIEAGYRFYSYGDAMLITGRVGA